MRVDRDTKHIKFQGEGGDSLTVHHDTMGEPFRAGISFHVENEDTQDSVGVFLEKLEARELRDLLNRIFPANGTKSTDREHAEKMLDSLNNACPWNTTFLFHEPGCEAIGQGTELAKAIERAMEKSFKLWVNTWMRPHVEDILSRP